MRNRKRNDTMMEKLSDWLPAILIIGGLGMVYLGIDKYAIVMNMGFFAHGVLGLRDSINRKYHKGFSLRTLKIVGQIAIALLAIDNFFHPGHFLILLLLLLIDRLILIPDRLESGNETNPD